MGALDDLVGKYSSGQLLPLEEDPRYKAWVAGGRQGALLKVPVTLQDTPATPDHAAVINGLLSKKSPQSAQGEPATSSVAGAGLRGAAQGVTFGTSDELAGLAAAAPEAVSSTIGKVPLLGSVVNAATGAVNLALHGDEAQSRYDKAVEEARAQLEADRSQHPIASTVGELGGALATIPATGFLNLFRGAGFGARLANSAIQGLAGGAAYGAGTSEGDLGQRAIGAAGGMGTGFAAGVALPVLGAGVRGAGRVARGAAQTMFSPGDQASRVIAEGLARDKVTPIQAADTLERARNAGVPMVVGDTGGAATRSRARQAASMSQEGRQTLEDVTNARFQNQGERAVDFIQGLTPGGGQAVDILERLKAAAVKAKRPAYAKAYAAGDRSIISPELERLMGSPDVVSAMKEAAATGKSRAIAEGFGAFNPVVKVTTDGRVMFAPGKGGVPTYPNIQFWDYTYRNLRDAGDEAFRKGLKSKGDYLSSLAKQMRAELDRLVPEFGQARAVAARFFGAEDALEAGQKFVTGNMPNAEARKAIARMSPAEKALFAEGFASELANQVHKTGNNRNVINSIFLNTPRAKERVVMALGSQAAADLEGYLRVEGTMDRLRTALGGSMTARNLVEIGAVGTAGFFLGGGNPFDPKSWLTAAIGAGLSKGRQKATSALNERVAQQVAEMLASSDPDVLRQGINQVSRNSRLMEALRWAEAAIVRATGMEGGQSIARAQAQNQNQ